MAIEWKVGRRQPASQSECVPKGRSGEAGTMVVEWRNTILSASIVCINSDSVMIRPFGRTSPERLGLCM